MKERAGEHLRFATENVEQSEDLEYAVGQTRGAGGFELHPRDLAWLRAANRALTPEASRSRTGLRSTWIRATPVRVRAFTRLSSRRPDVARSMSPATMTRMQSSPMVSVRTLKFGSRPGPAACVFCLHRPPSQAHPSSPSVHTGQTMRITDEATTSSGQLVLIHYLGQPGASNPPPDTADTHPPDRHIEHRKPTRHRHRCRAIAATASAHRRQPARASRDRPPGAWRVNRAGL